MATQLEFPNMNHCPRCEGRWKKCSLCNGTGTIPNEILEICRLLQKPKTIETKAELNSIYGPLIAITHRDLAPR